MTQTRPRSTLPLRLVSMQLPEAIDWIGQTRLASEDVLLLMPGKAAEIALQLENTGSHSLQWEIQVTGNFSGKLVSRSAASWRNSWRNFAASAVAGRLAVSDSDRFF